MHPGISSPSLGGNATRFDLGGATPYGDALFAAELIGQDSPQLQDSNHSLLPTLHNFVYDSYFYVTDASISQALEFDVVMFMDGVDMTWGTQCNHLGDGDWDIWDNTKLKWVSADVPCNFVNGWNHVILHVQRKAGNILLYQSIELNGTIYNLNITDAPGVAPEKWWGVAANYQMDGNYNQSPNTTYLDNFTFTYW